MKKQQTADALAPEDLLMTVDPRIYRAVHNLAKIALTVGQNNKMIRDRISDLAFAFRQAGHEEAFEVRALYDLLRQTDTAEQPIVMKVEDPLQRMSRLEQLTADQIGAAILIKRVWAAFAKVLGSRGSNWNGRTSGRGVVHPSDLMDSELVTLYTEAYRPWFAAMLARPERIVGKVKVRAVGIVMGIVIEQRSLRRVSKVLTISQAHALDILRDELISLSSRMASVRDKGEYYETQSVEEFVQDLTKRVNGGRTSP